MTSRVDTIAAGKRAGAVTGARCLFHGWIFVSLALWLGVVPVAADDPPPAKPAAAQPAAQAPAEPDDSRLVKAVFSPRKDGQGNTWDFNSLGAVEYGEAQTFAGAALLFVNNKVFDAAEPKMAPGGLEYALNWSEEPLVVTRRIRIDRERGAAVYLEHFTNASDNPADAVFSLRTTLARTNFVITCTEGAAPPADALPAPLPDGESAIAALPASPELPGVVFVLAGTGAPVRPQLKIQQNHQLEVTYTLPLKPRESRAVLHVIAQRRSLNPESAKALAREIVQAGPASLVPEPLVSQVANFAARAPAPSTPAGDDDASGLLETATAVAASLKAERGADATLVVDQESSVKGEARVERLSIETAAGRVDTRLEEVALVLGGGGYGRPERLLFRNGEILTGRLAARGFVFRAAAGFEVPLDPPQFDALVLAKLERDDARPAPAANGFVVTRGGDRLAVSFAPDAPVTIDTAWGALHIRLGEIRRISTPASSHPGFFWELQDRSRLIALLGGEGFPVTSIRFGPLKLTAASLREFWIGRTGAAAGTENLEPPQPPYVRLAGKGFLAAEPSLDALPLALPSGATEFPGAQIATIERNAEEPRSVVVKLIDQAKVSGTWPLQAIRFRRGEDRLTIPVDHLLLIDTGRPVKAAATETK